MGTAGNLCTTEQQVTAELRSNVENSITIASVVHNIPATHGAQFQFDSSQDGSPHNCYECSRLSKMFFSFSHTSSNQNWEKPFLETTEKVDTSAYTPIRKFRKCLWGLYVVTADFDAFDENEITVHKGEQVSVWNCDEEEWYWVVKPHNTSSEEGFVPSCCLQVIVSADFVQAHRKSVYLFC